MRDSAKLSKRALSLVLLMILLVSTLAFAFTAHAEEVDEIADTGADTYYLWGENSNSPDFNASSPTGKFTYDSSKGYYYYDLTGSSGDYCFVVSTVSNSANYAVRTPAVSSVASSGPYYLTAGNYHGYNCMHIWNPSGDAVRLYFTSTSAGLNAVKAGSEDPTDPPAPTQKETTVVTPTTVSPTTPSPTTPSPTTPSTDKRYIYCENEAGWDAVYAYLWNSNSDKNRDWPGVKMTNIGGNVWRYELTKSYANIIFNIGSDSNKTADMVYPGDGYIYNNSTKEWEVYDTSPLQISAYTTDLEAPQYNGVAITLYAEAEGQGTVYYKFSVTNGSNTVVLSDYSTKNKVEWIPNAAGTYTLTYDFKDAAGNTNRRTKSYTVEDGLASVAPYIKTVSPAGGEIKRSTQVNLSVSAGGGITGTKLLFYKYTVKDAGGNIVNVPYYTLNGTSYKFTPTATGAYTVTVSVQGSDNKTVERTYSYDCVNSLTPTEGYETQPPTEAPKPTEKPTEAPKPTEKPTEAPKPTEKPTEAPKPTEKPTEAPKPTEKPTEAPKPTEAAVMYGDCDEDGDVNSIDVTYIQRHEVGIDLPTPINLKNADVDADGEVIIIDATLVQRYLAGIINKFPAEI